ncbi:MAG: beta-lactamase family protein [Candidatus Obscuribacterales bacterium]|nr:beta-lactamase family protein [Candidatus Obscuribacterales bacterium]
MIATKMKKSRRTKSSTKKTLADYMEACVDVLDFSGSVLVHRKEKIYLSDGFGKADRENNARNKADTVFRLASISKQFTAMMTMMMVDEGMIKLNDKIGKYLNKVPEKWKGITITNLLTHTAGLPNYTEIPEFVEGQRDPITPGEIYERLKKFPLKFTPGTAAEYNDSGFTILGHILEMVGDKLYGDLLTEHIFEPLSMHRTGYDIWQMIIPNRARGYVRPDKNTIMNAPYIDMSLPHAAGALCSTVEDMYLWDRALKNNTLIPKKLSEIMFKPHRDIYACGWMIDEQLGLKRIQHMGGIDGFQTAILRFPEADACVIVLSNVETSIFSSFGIAEALATILFHEEVEFPRAKK